MEIVFIILTAVLVSAFGSVVGFGGGVFMIPILVTIFHLPINLAVGSVIIALLPGSLISTYFNVRSKSIDYYTGIFLEIPTIAGTVVGSLLTSLIPVFWLELIFSVFVFYLGLNMYRKSGKDIPRINKNSFFYKLNRIGPGIIRRSPVGAYRVSYGLAVLFGMISGVMAGLFGIGGGFLKIPIMINVFNIPPFMASATALFMIVFTSATGSFSHYLLDHIKYDYALPVIAGFIIGAFLGNKLNIEIGPKTIKKLIGSGLVLAGLFVFFYSLSIL